MEFKSKYDIGDEVYFFGGDAIAKFKIGGVKHDKDGMIAYIEDGEEGKRPMVVLEKFTNKNFDDLKATIIDFYKQDCENMCKQVSEMKAEDLEEKEDDK